MLDVRQPTKIFWTIDGTGKKGQPGMAYHHWSFVYGAWGMTTPDYIRAHRHSMHNREEILSSDRCGCFYCGTMFPPTEVRDWTDEREDIGQTALCPKCGIDAVIGSKSGYPITIDFLGLMRAHWFQIAKDKINHTQ